MNARLFIGGEWVGSGETDEVLEKFRGEPIGTIPVATPAHVDAAVAAASRAAPVMAALPAWRRAEILERTAVLLGGRREDIARTLAMESGKALKWARVEVDRACATFTFAAEEAKRIAGETVPLDATPSGSGFAGWWTRRPVGVVAAITPFNFPLNLVAHKVAPALAAGNAIVLKPAEQTPLTAVALCEVLAEAGAPPGAVNLVHGPGPAVGAPLVCDPRVAKVSFTGSREVGEAILRTAGIKKVTLELGNNSPVVVAADADLDHAAARCAAGAFYNAGQVCVSVQRIYVEGTVEEAFRERLLAATAALVTGDPLDERTDVGPMIDEREAARVESWIAEAKGQGARLLCGGGRTRSLHAPTLLDAVPSGARIASDEVFGPVASLFSADGFDTLVKQAAATDYGLQAGVFTRDLDRVFHAIAKLDFGGVIVNDAPTFRADHMPYGGNKRSGLGREGVRFAIEEMTNIQMVAIRLQGVR